MTSKETHFLYLINKTEILQIFHFSVLVAGIPVHSGDNRHYRLSGNHKNNSRVLIQKYISVSDISDKFHLQSKST